MTRSFLRALLAIILLLVVRATVAAQTLRELPLQLAFTRIGFGELSELAVSRDARYVAYTTQKPHGAIPINERYFPNGTPTAAAGKSLYVTDSEGRTTVEVCPSLANRWRPSWTPSGQLAFYSDADGSPRLWIFDRATAQCRNVTRATIKTSYALRRDAVQWSPDGRIAYVAIDPHPDADHSALSAATENKAAFRIYRSGGEMEPGEEERIDRLQQGTDYFLRESNAAIAAVDLQTGQTKILAAADSLPPPWDIVQVSPSGKWLAYRSVRYWPTGASHLDIKIDLAVVAASGGQARVVARGLAAHSGPMNVFGTDAVWHPRKDWLFYIKDGKLWRVDFTAGDAGEPQPMPAGGSAVAPSVLWFTRDARWLLIGLDPLGDDQGNKPAKLALIDFDGKPSTEFSLQSKKWLLLDVLKSDASTLWQSDGRSIVLMLRDKASSELCIARIDPKSGDISVMWKGFAKLAEFAGASDGSLFGIYEDLNTPPDVYRFSGDFSRRQRISIIEPRFEGVRIGTAHYLETTYPASDGSIKKSTTAVVLPPHARPGERLPAIVMIYPLHGSRSMSAAAASFGAGWEGNSVPNMIFLSRGYAVLLTDIDHGPYSRPGNPIQQIVEGLLPQMYRAADLGYVDIGRLAISGVSYGAYGTAGVVTRTNLFRAGIPVNGLYDLGAAYGRLLPDGSSISMAYMETSQGSMGAPPWADVLRYVENSPYYQLDKITTPLLIVAGEGDMTTPAAEAEKLFAGLRRLDRPAQLALYAGEGHTVTEWSLANAIDASRRMLEFLDKHIGPGFR